MDINSKPIIQSESNEGHKITKQQEFNSKKFTMNFKVIIPLVTFLTIGNCFIIQGEKESQMQSMSTSMATICLGNINKQRANNGRPPLQSNQQVEAAAYKHNAYMMDNNCFSHQCPGEAEIGDRLSATGYRWSGVGEILVTSYDNCDSAVQAWMNSAGHRAIILGDYRHVGCSGLTCSDCPNAGPWWTCVFASPA